MLLRGRPVKRPNGRASRRFHNRLDMLPTMTDFDLVHLDEALLVVNKPAGLLSVPGKGEGQRLNLTCLLRHHFADLQVVHRLDQATSGLMLFARNANVQRSLSMAFERRQVHKRYVAVVLGRVADEEGVIEAPLAADWPRRPRQMVDLLRGKPSITRWSVVQRETASTRLLLEPVTGRSHQLRVHMQFMGHPILGDSLYGEEAASQPQRLLLHATQLSFCHPATGAELVLRSAAPF